MPHQSPSEPPRLSVDGPCLNCWDATPGNYCPSCGQARRDVAVSVGALVADVLEDQLFLGKALPRTLKALFLRPGLLTREYMQGRRAHYIAPFRLYLAASVVFFVLFTTFGLRGLRAPDPTAADAPAAESGSATTDAGGDAAGPAQPGVQPWANTLEINIGNAETNARVRQRTIERFGHLPFVPAMRAFLLEYLRYAPRVVFLLLPLFALILKILYAGSGRFYVEHFVFSLHLHTFAFGLASLALVMGVRLGAMVVGVSLLVYTWMALRTVYGRGIVATTATQFALGVSYFVFVTVAFALTVVVTLLRL